MRNKIFIIYRYVKIFYVTYQGLDTDRCWISIRDKYAIETKINGSFR